MSTNELLAAYAERADAEAFRQIAHDHARAVFSTCKRILGDAAEAEDVTQECFLELARNARRVKGPLGAWLHGIATRKSLHAARTRRRRQMHERAAQTMPRLESDATWAEIEPLVDEAIEALPEDLRRTLILHFIQGRNQTEIGQELGISQPTVSRRLDQALELLRATLSKRGVLVGTISLAALSATTADAAPTTLMASLGKMAATGPTAAKAFGTATVLKIISTLAAVTVIATAGAVIAGEKKRLHPPASVAVKKAVAAPTPLKETDVTGQILLPDGSPAAGAQVRFLWIHCTSGFGTQWAGESAADANGNFVLGKPEFQPPTALSGMPITRMYIVATRPGFAATFTEFRPSRMRGYSLALQKGRSVNVAVVDRADKPVAGADVSLITFDVFGNGIAGSDPALSGVRNEINRMLYSGRTDANGLFVVNDAPVGLIGAKAMHGRTGAGTGGTSDTTPSILVRLMENVTEIHGQVTLMGRNVPAKNVFVHQNTVNGAWAVSDDKGSFVLKCETRLLVAIRANSGAAA